MKHELRPANRSWQESNSQAVNRLLEMTRKLNDLRQKAEGLRKQSLPGLFLEAEEESPSSGEASKRQ